MEDHGLRIPKISVPVVCHSIQGEAIEGAVFLDYSQGEKYTTRDMLNFFNSSLLFVPLARPSGTPSILISKNSIIRVDVPGLLGEFEKETVSTFATRKEAVIHSQLGPVQATIIIDMPEESSRILDLLNQGIVFFPAIVGAVFSLFNSRQVHKIEEA